MKRFAMMMVLVLAIFGIMTGCSDSSKTKEKSEEKDKLVIGIDDKFAPMGFRDENNKIVGFDIDYATAAAEKMDIDVKFQPIDWATKEAELNSGRIDLIWNGYTITDERKEKVLFTKPYLANAQVVVTLTDSKINKLSDLEGKVVGLQSLSSAADALAASPIQSKIKTVTEFSDNVTALNDLKSGRIDAVVIDQIVIDYYMTKDKESFKILDEALAPEEYAVGVKKGNKELLDKVQKALDEMNEDGTAEEISNKWFGENKVLK